MARAAETKFDPVVDEALASQPLADARLQQQVHAALLEHAGANAVLDVVTAAALDDHRLDALPVQKVREQQPRGPRADDADLCAQLQRIRRVRRRSVRRRGPFQ